MSQLAINLDKYHGHVTSCYTLITDQVINAGQDVTLVDSSGGAFKKKGQVVSICPVNLKDHTTFPSVIAWATCGTNSMRAVDMLQKRYPKADKATVVVVQVRE